jgi:hypothetical protein
MSQYGLSSTPKIEAVSSSEISVKFCKTTRRRITAVSTSDRVPFIYVLQIGQEPGDTVSSRVPCIVPSSYKRIKYKPCSHVANC